MIMTQWGAPGLSPDVVAQLDTLLAEARQATTNRLLAQATVTYQERALTAYAARVGALEDFIRAQGLTVPGEEPVAPAAPVDPATGPLTGQF